MKNALGEIKYSFHQGLMYTRIIYVNILFFFVTLIFNFVVHLLSKENTYIYDYIVLHTDIYTLLQHPWTIFTYSLFHRGVWHILLNMLILYFSGKIFTEYLRGRYLLNVYILGVLFGGLFFVISMNVFPLFSKISQYSSVIIGSSAGVMAVLVAITTYVPTYILRMPLFGNFKLWHITLFFIFLDLLSFQKSGNEGGHISHIGGVIIGFVYAKQIIKKKDMGKWINIILDKIYSIFARKKNNIYVRKNIPKNDYDYNRNKRQIQYKIDEILGKISKSGYESLSKYEKEFLFKNRG